MKKDFPHCTSCTCLSVWLTWSHLPELRIRRSHWSIGMAGNRYDHGPLAAWLAVLGACQAVLPPKSQHSGVVSSSSIYRDGQDARKLTLTLRLALLCVFRLLHCLKPGPVLPVLHSRCLCHHAASSLWAVGLISESWELLMVSHVLSCHLFVPQLYSWLHSCTVGQQDPDISFHLKLKIFPKYRN